jgi:hypothetical protein
MDFLVFGYRSVSSGSNPCANWVILRTATVAVADAEAIQMLYVSLATITTLGNSEVPVTFLARHLTTIEAITGQLYLAVLIARLVGFSSVAGPTSDRSD